MNFNLIKPKYYSINKIYFFIKRKTRERNATFTTLLQQILSNRLLQAIIGGKKIILVVGSN